VSFQIRGISSKDVDITQEEPTRFLIREWGPSVIVHAAAFTQVDACESDQKKAYEINGAGTRHVAMGAQDVGARLLAVSTDYVFDGTKSGPYREDDPPAPMGVYGKSKWLGEQALQEVLEDYLIIRTSWLFGRYGPNFVKTILRLAESQPSLRVVQDQKGSPTYTPDLAEAIDRLLKSDARGIVHVSNSGSCTWWEYAEKILTLTGKDRVVVHPISTAESGRPAPRPANSILDNTRYESITGHRMRPWQDALSAYLKDG
jgi:dTDP-4-dehydrorhamnose reductase